jgi:hypothetical protein
MKSSLQSLILFLPFLLNHLWLPSEETCSVLFQAGLASSSYGVWLDPMETPFPSLSQQYFNCCLLIRCCGNVFTESLPSNKRLLWLHYSSFQVSCHNIVSLLQALLVVAWLQYSNKGYSWHPYGSRTALPNHQLKTDSWSSQSHIMTNGQFACQAPSEVQDQTFVTVRQLWFCQWGAPSLMRGHTVIYSSQNQ